MGYKRSDIEFKRFDDEPTEIFKERILGNLVLMSWSGTDIIEVLKPISDTTMVVTLNVDRCNG
jgi:hypothetical protein